MKIAELLQMMGSECGRKRAKHDWFMMSCMIIRMRSQLIVILLALVSLTARAAAAPPVSLAEVYQQGVDLSTYWLSEKYDGVRAYWDGEQLLSRQGNAFSAPDWFIATLPEQALDGELWIGRGQFAKVSSTVRKYTAIDAEWRSVRFMVFDLPDHPGPFSVRYAALEQLLIDINTPHLVLVAQSPVANHSEVMQRRDEIVARGGEGVMLKRHTALYHAGRSADLLKVKPHDDAEGEVIAHLPGKGRHTGRLGALLIRLKNGRTLKLGTGFTDQERENPPPLGSLVTFRYRGLTKTGLPRFASFMRVRDDQIEQETDGSEPN